MEYLNPKLITASLVYSLLGIIVLVLSFVILEKLTPQTLWREILEKQNVALAIVAAAFMISVALIISAAVHG